MKLARLGEAGTEIPVVVSGDCVLDARPVTPDYDHDFFESEGISQLAEAVRSHALPKLSGSSGLRVGPPVARPGAVFGVGLNYAAHAAESGAVPPAEPILFMKPPNTIVGPNDSVIIPAGSRKTDWEVELALVIGKRASRLDSVDVARDYVAGFAIADDVSERAHQLEGGGGQWAKGKSSPGFCPLGPWLVTPDETDWNGLALRSAVNGHARQNSNTNDMIFDPYYIVWHLSQYLAFDPGDVVLTGTPEGVALSGRFDFLRDGDYVEMSIEGLGSQRHQFVAGQ